MDIKHSFTHVFCFYLFCFRAGDHPKNEMLYANEGCMRYVCVDLSLASVSRFGTEGIPAWKITFYTFVPC